MDALKKGKSGCFVSSVTGGSYNACGSTGRTWYKIKAPGLRVTGYVAARCMLEEKQPRR